jgi:hypothetical protein
LNLIATILRLSQKFRPFFKFQTHTKNLKDFFYFRRNKTQKNHQNCLFYQTYNHLNGLKRMLR